MTRCPRPDGVEPQRKHRCELCPGKSLYITAGTVALRLVNDMATKGPLRARGRANCRSPVGGGLAVAAIGATATLVVHHRRVRMSRRWAAGGGQPLL